MIFEYVREEDGLQNYELKERDHRNLRVQVMNIIAQCAKKKLVDILRNWDYSIISINKFAWMV